MELENERKNATVDVTSLERLYLDVRGLEGYTMRELKTLEEEIRQQDFTFSIENYYLEGEDKWTDNLKRALSLEFYMQKKGIHASHPLRQMVHHGRFGLANGVLYLHPGAF